MEVDELPQFDPNVDYNVILPIHQKRMLAFINNFITSTVSFLNDFGESCESRLLEFEYKLQKVEASLLILESQLASIPDLDDKDEFVTKIIDDKVGLDLPEIVAEDIKVENDVAELASRGTKASEDSRFSKFFKMVQFGVPAQAVKLKMANEGIDPDILENPNAIIPGKPPPANKESDSDSSSM